MDDDIDMEALPAVLVPPVRLDPYCCPNALLLRPCGPVINSWSIVATYTVKLASGAQVLRPLVMQAISTTLARLMVVAGRLFPYVTTTSGVYAPRGAVPKGMYMVTAVYPNMVQGHKQLVDGVICEQTTPVAVIVSIDDKEFEAALATAKTRTGPPAGAWNTALRAAANSLMSDDSLEELSFSDFRVNSSS
jgi:hypothetical protein